MPASNQPVPVAAILPPSIVRHPAKEERIGPIEVLGRVTMQLLIRDHRTVIAATVQRDVDGIPEGTHVDIITHPNVGGKARARAMAD
jgi:hypothetical protein